MNHAQANYLGKQLERFLQGTTANIGLGGIIAELTKAQGDPLDVITAAWVTVRKIRSGQYRTFQMIHDELSTMLINDHLPPAPAPAPMRPRPAGDRAHPLDTRQEPECPKHQGQRADNCGGCRADQLAAPPADYPYLLAS